MVCPAFRRIRLAVGGSERHADGTLASSRGTRLWRAPWATLAARRPPAARRRAAALRPAAEPSERAVRSPTTAAARRATIGARTATEQLHMDCGGTCAPCGDEAHCAVDADCASGVCSHAACRAASCTDSVLNGMESDVDLRRPGLPGLRGVATLHRSDRLRYAVLPRDAVSGFDVQRRGARRGRGRHRLRRHGLRPLQERQAVPGGTPIA